MLKEEAVLSKTNLLKRQSLEEFNILKEYIINNLNLKFIESNQAEYGSLILFIKKPSEGFRLYIDY